MQKNKNIPVMLLVIAGMFLYSCKYDKISKKESCTGKIPSTVSFSNDVLPILNSNCNQSGCHNNVDHAGNLILTDSLAYSELFHPGTGYIDTLNPNLSLLYSKLISASDYMPPAGKLDSCTIRIIFSWIQQKARNN